MPSSIETSLKLNNVEEYSSVTKADVKVLDKLSDAWTDLQNQSQSDEINGFETMQDYVSEKYCNKTKNFDALDINATISKYNNKDLSQ